MRFCGCASLLGAGMVEYRSTLSSITSDDAFTEVLGSKTLRIAESAPFSYATGRVSAQVFLLSSCLPFSTSVTESQEPDVSTCHLALSGKFCLSSSPRDSVGKRAPLIVQIHLSFKCTQGEPLYNPGINLFSLSIYRAYVIGVSHKGKVSLHLGPKHALHLFDTHGAMETTRPQNNPAVVF